MRYFIIKTEELPTGTYTGALPNLRESLLRPPNLQTFEGIVKTSPLLTGAQPVPEPVSDFGHPLACVRGVGQSRPARKGSLPAHAIDGTMEGVTSFHDGGHGLKCPLSPQGWYSSENRAPKNSPSDNLPVSSCATLAKRYRPPFLVHADTEPVFAGSTNQSRAVGSRSKRAAGSSDARNRFETAHVIVSRSVLILHNLLSQGVQVRLLEPRPSRLGEIGRHGGASEDAINFDT